MKVTLSRSGRTLTIDLGKLVRHYDVEDLEPDKRVARRAWRLKREDGTFDDVHVDEWGPGCTCGDFTFRGSKDGMCKHIEALMDIGWIPKQKAVKHGS